MVLAGLLVAGSSFFLFTTLKSELAPIEDRGTIVGMGIAPEGSTLEFTDHYGKQIEALYQQVPEIRQYFLVTGFPVVSQVISFSRLVDWEERERKQQEVAAELGPRMFGIPGLMAFPVNPPSLGPEPGREAGAVRDPDLAAVRGTAEAGRCAAGRGALSGMVNLDTDLKLNKPELKVDLDREKVANIGLEVDTVGRARDHARRPSR